ncbi:MAG: CDP-glucose 4,6-dehydratase [Chloroflexi bacterium]|nr:MAG: CDP-glucose 4,6-dehydratase [Chloroflexota bacterium]
MNHLFNNIFEDLTVLITGHTGFKGSWLTIWLKELGANVIGFALEDPPTNPSNYIASKISSQITDIRGDIRDYDQLYNVIKKHKPTIIFHLAAQPIVLKSIAESRMTFETNTMGTINVLEAIRQTNCVKALVSITTDKVYHNEEWLWGYRETDRLGGHDPYSASKAMAELAITSYRDTYFPPEKYDEHGVAIASARAGNVIGGGDFGEFRLIPDCMNALMGGESIGVRNPLSVRPWQLVLEPLSGYMWLAVKLLEDGPNFAEAWNFGPLETNGISTQAIAEKLVDLWGSGSWEHTDPGYAKIETGYLRLTWEKAAQRLGWRPVYTWEEALAEITTWFKAFTQSADMHEVCRSHIDDYIAQATELGLPWTKKM